MSDTARDTYVVIMAGGSGTRLWPLSRQKRPKQLLPLTGGRSLIEETVQRVLPMVPAERVLIVTTADHAPATQEALPMLPEENVIAEPVGRDSAPCVGFAATLVAHKDPSAVLVTLSADHWIEPAEAFRENALAAIETARSADCLVTIGIEPERPDTRFGYIERGEPVGKVRDQEVYRVKQFREKPDEATAKEYVDSGRFFWNAGIFFWRAETILAQFEEFLPEHYEKLQAIAQTLDTERERETIETVYPTFEKISIDYGVMEKAPDVRMVPATFRWDDVGSFEALAAYLDADDQSNAVRGDHVAIDASGNVVVSEGEHTVTLVGVRDMVVVHTDDATLVVPRDRATDVKALVNELKSRKRDDLT